MEHIPVTVIIPTYNEEINISNCLESIDGLCQQVIIVDSGSTDNTIKICRSYQTEIVEHPYIDHALFWQWALANLKITNDWILPLDADHIVSPDLRREFSQLFSVPNPEINGYYARHKILFMGGPIRGFKEYSLRLFKLSKISMDMSELVDFRFVVAGRTHKLTGILYEDNKKEEKIDFWIDKHQNFSTRMAIEELLRRKGIVNWSITPNLFGNHDQRIVWFKNIWYRLPLFIRPFMYYIYRYFFRLGILDGKPGFIYHFLQAFWFRFIIDVKIFSLKMNLNAGRTTLDEIFQAHGHIQRSTEVTLE